MTALLGACSSGRDPQPAVGGAAALEMAASNDATPAPGASGSVGAGSGARSNEGPPELERDPEGDGPTDAADPRDAGRQVPASGVHVDGPRLVVDGALFHIRGVGYNPIGIGGNHPQNLDYAGFAAVDIPLMAAAGINVVRTYEPLLDRGVLDQLAAAGIYVIESVYPFGGAPVTDVIERVRVIKDHPAVLMWAVGNEWNYNGLYVGLSHDDAVARLNDAVALIKAEDPSHPVATIYGELPTAETLQAMPGVDIWGINAYRGISFGALFTDWANLSDKPMFLGEYGADAYNATSGMYDPESQALAVGALTRELMVNASALVPGGVTLGGAVFEWADEWWKDAEGALDVQDVGGIAPGGGPYPDQTFNEEWWGIVDIRRERRAAYGALREVFAAPVP